MTEDILGARTHLKPKAHRFDPVCSCTAWRVDELCSGNVTWFEMAVITRRSKGLLHGAFDFLVRKKKTLLSLFRNNSSKQRVLLHRMNFVVLLLLFLYRIPFQQSGYIPLEAGKYYWIEALHKEGARRDSLSVGYTLECPNAPSVLSEKPILKPSLQYKIPRKCCCSSAINVLRLVFCLPELNLLARIILRVHVIQEGSAEWF